MAPGAKSEGEGQTLHEQRNLTPEEIEERTAAKLKADEESSKEVHDKLDADNKKVNEQLKQEAEEVKADKEKADAESKKASKKPEAAHGGGGAGPSLNPQHRPTR